MISVYVVVRILAAVGAVAVSVLFVGAYKLVLAAVNSHRRTGVHGKPAFSNAE